ncbi:MAG TPA: histidine kinase [Thermoanaerobaculia bacterium]|jgi:signal transduction histidine kinase|nr:histidine kinase [Thermoanaerobaculia bacterium]
MTATRGEPGWHLSGREVAIIVAFWTSLAALTVLNRLYDPRSEGLRVIARTGPLVLPFVEAWLWAALTPLVFWISSRSSGAMSRLSRIALLVLAGIVIAIFVDGTLDVARDLFAPRRRGGPSFVPFRGFGRFGPFNQLLIYCGVLTAGFAREYFQREQRHARESAHLEALLAHARLNALRMQLNPHFLFNTLNAVSALVERDPSGVRKMIARLSELLRHTLDTNSPDEIALRDELAFLQRYLDIMAVRFQGKLRVSTSVDEAVLDAKVPIFILQPLVENALEHGTSAMGDAEIEVRARRDGNQLALSVHDRGPGLDTTAEGVGLTNTRARLAALYGDAASVAMRTSDAGGAAAELRLPWRDA